MFARRDVRFLTRARVPSLRRDVTKPTTHFCPRSLAFVPAKIDHLPHPANPFFVFLFIVALENAEDRKNGTNYAVSRISPVGSKGGGTDTSDRQPAEFRGLWGTGVPPVPSSLQERAGTPVPRY